MLVPALFTLFISFAEAPTAPAPPGISNRPNSEYEISLRSGVVTGKPRYSSNNYEIIHVAPGKYWESFVGNAFISYGRNDNFCGSDHVLISQFNNEIISCRGAELRVGAYMRLIKRSGDFHPWVGGGIALYHQTASGKLRNLGYEGADDFYGPPSGIPEPFTKTEQGALPFVLLGAEYALTSAVAIGTEFQLGVRAPLANHPEYLFGDEPHESVNGTAAIRLSFRLE